ncbi:MAG: hypothetical protein EZS28_011833 [Streblomastix strix]|uniref:Uncharacterized protein n=1 Tax=Streblomastix strix TaxID=222440 RepID=A0A5J4WCT0_9EUKA|nr:MAG: hypothetical protein EZS28_011833 [Streblomastix strix]
MLLSTAKIQSSLSTRLDWNDDLTARSPEGTLLMDQENYREQQIINIRPNSTSNSSNRCLTPMIGSNSRTIFQRGSSSSWSMAKLPNTMDKQQERTAGYPLKNNSFHKTPAERVIYLICQYQNMKIDIQHFSEKINIIADALSRLQRSEDFHLRPFFLNQIRMTKVIQPTFDIFAPATIKLLVLYVTVNITTVQAQLIDVFQNTWTNKILLVRRTIQIH